METQAGLMKELGLGQPLISWHTVRDNFAEVGAFLGIVGGSLGKIAMDVKLMMQTEVAEVFEPFAPGRGSSSTMPQKRNPISCLYIHQRAPGGVGGERHPKLRAQRRRAVQILAGSLRDHIQAADRPVKINAGLGLDGRVFAGRVRIQPG